ncbi:MAG: hypothetical protein COS87_03295, partial [Chloroflexi bacterium CG07_land_8_20_14_0_80_45_17]
MKLPEVGKFSQGRFLKKALRQASWLISLLIIIGLAAIFVACSPSGSESDTGQPRAAIIDQLCSTQPNDDFITQVNRDLEAFGFVVHVYQGN